MMQAMSYKLTSIEWLSNPKLSTLVVAIISLLVYMNTIYNGFVYDDFFQVINNPWIRDVRHLPDIFLTSNWGFRESGWVSNYYRPLMHVIYTADYLLFGLRPWGFHLTNIIFHTGISVLIFFITRTLLEQSAAPREEKVMSSGFALMAALLFATHPVHTEVVAWIAGIPDLSATFFYLLSFYLFIQTDKVNGIKYILSVFFYFLALFCKEIAVTLPVLLFVYDCALGKELFRTRSSFLKRYLPYFIATGIYFILRTHAIGGFAPKRSVYLTDYQYFINIFPLFIEYLKKLIYPTNLNVFHVFHPILSIFESNGASTLILTMVLISFAYSLRNMDRLFTFSLLWIAIPLMPVLYIPALGENPFAERYLYLPSVGFVILASVIARSAWHCKEGVLPLIILFFAITCGLFSMETIKRNRVWMNDFALWNDTIKKSPTASNAHNNLGKAYYDRGMINKAIEHYQIAIKLKPAFPEAHNNLAIAYQIKGSIDKAIEHYQIAIKMRPDFPEAHSNLGVALQNKGLIDEAIMHYTVALMLRPDNPAAHNNIGRAYFDKGAKDKAIEHCRIAIRLRPDFQEARNNLKEATGEE